MEVIYFSFLLAYLVWYTLSDTLKAIMCSSSIITLETEYIMFELMHVHGVCIYKQKRMMKVGNCLDVFTFLNGTIEAEDNRN